MTRDPADRVTTAPILVAPLKETELPEAERIFRTAFGTFLGIAEPATFWSDRDYVYGRWHAPHVAALCATRNEELIGSNFATRWGSVGFFGPIQCAPIYRNRGPRRRYWPARWRNLTPGGSPMLGCSPSHRARNISLYTRSLVSTRAS